MPTTLRPCPSTRATKHTTLLVPISSAATTPFLVFATVFPRFPTHTLLDSHSCRSNWPARRFTAGRAFPEIELVGESQVDNPELARQKLVLGIKFGQTLERRYRVLLRQPDLDAVGQDQVPAALCHPDRAAQLLGDARF